MPAFKDLFYKIATPVAAVSGFSGLRKLTGINAISPLYHAVNDTVPTHLKYLYPIRTVNEFEADLDTLLAHFEPVTLLNYLAHTLGNPGAKKPVFHLTFDDGLSEFNNIAAPILLRKGVPATCFLNDDFIGNHDMLFRFKASLLIEHLHNASTGSKAWEGFHAWQKKTQPSPDVLP